MARTLASYTSELTKLNGEYLDMYWNESPKAALLAKKKIIKQLEKKRDYEHGYRKKPAG